MQVDFIGRGRVDSAEIPERIEEDEYGPAQRETKGPRLSVFHLEPIVRLKVIRCHRRNGKRDYGGGDGVIVSATRLQKLAVLEYR